MEVIGKEITLALAHLSAAKEVVGKAAEKLALGDPNRSDLWRIWLEIENQMRQVVMVGREQGLNLPVYWLDEVK